MTENELASIAVDISFKIHSTLGPGLLESVYEAAFAFELDKRNIAYTRQMGFNVFYEGKDLGLGFRSDLVLEKKLLIELKSIENVANVHHKITLTYLKLLEIKLGLLVNFNVDKIKDGIHRKINGYF
ncbi:MAG: GxxExxY protein [Bacteroidota bacterium]|nr:GxxExxY protein [Bacteroidota bacterium]